MVEINPAQFASRRNESWPVRKQVRVRSVESPTHQCATCSADLKVTSKQIQSAAPCSYGANGAHSI